MRRARPVGFNLGHLLLGLLSLIILAGTTRNALASFFPDEWLLRQAEFFDIHCEDVSAQKWELTDWEVYRTLRAGSGVGPTDIGEGDRAVDRMRTGLCALLDSMDEIEQAKAIYEFESTNLH